MMLFCFPKCASTGMDSGKVTIQDIDIWHMNVTESSAFQYNDGALSIFFCCMASGLAESREIDGNRSIETHTARPNITLPSSAPFILLKVLDHPCSQGLIS